MREYEMTQEELDEIMDASKPVPAMWIGGPPSTPQENANRAWQRLAKKKGFKWDTVKPSRRNDQRFFYAAPAEDTQT